MRGVEHVLLTYVGRIAEPAYIQLIESVAKKLKAAGGPQCRLVIICSSDAEKFDVVGATIVKDVAGEFVAAYSPAANTGYLIRPDGYIGYCGRPMNERGVFDYLGMLSMRSM